MPQQPLSAEFADASAGQAKPFVKWVGGKRSLLRELLKRVPSDVNKYCEPFVGGGALFFALRARTDVRGGGGDHISSVISMPT